MIYELYPFCKSYRPSLSCCSSVSLWKNLECGVPYAVSASAVPTRSITAFIIAVDAIVIRAETCALAISLLSLDCRDTTTDYLSNISTTTSHYYQPSFHSKLFTCAPHSHSSHHDHLRRSQGPICGSQRNQIRISKIRRFRRRPARSSDSFQASFLTPDKTNAILTSCL